MRPRMLSREWVKRRTAGCWDWLCEGFRGMRYERLRILVVRILGVWYVLVGVALWFGYWGRIWNEAGSGV